MKPTFDDIYYDNITSFIGAGNRLKILRPIAHIVTNQEAYDKECEEKRKEAEEIYNTYINRNQKFIPKGENGHSEILAMITSINPITSTVSWKQINIDDWNKIYDLNLKPAKGKWSIVGMIHLFLTEQIEFI